MVTGALVATGVSWAGRLSGFSLTIRSVLAVCGLAALAARELGWLRFRVPDLNLIVPATLVATSPIREAVLWGGILGAGFLTLIRYGAWWGFQLTVFAMASPSWGALAGAAYGIARSAPAVVLWLRMSLRLRCLTLGGQRLLGLSPQLAMLGGISMIVAALVFAYTGGTANAR